MVSQIKVDSILESSSGNGVTIDGSLIKDGSVAGIMEEVDQWVNTGNITSSQNPITTWARPSGLLLPSGAAIGTGMSVSSGIWTFPSTGIYSVKFQALVRFSAYSGGFTYIYTTNDNGTTWDNVSSTEGQGQTNYDTANIHLEVIIDVQNVSNDKVKFRFYDEGSATLVGSTDYTGTSVMFRKLGDT